MSAKTQQEDNLQDESQDQIDWLELYKKELEGWKIEHKYALAALERLSQQDSALLHKFCQARITFAETMVIQWESRVKDNQDLATSKSNCGAIKQ